MNQQLAAIRRIRPVTHAKSSAIDTDVTSVTTVHAIDVANAIPTKRIDATPAGDVVSATEQARSGPRHVERTLAETCEPRADEGWRRQLIGALKDIDKQGLRLDAPLESSPQTSAEPLALPELRLNPPRIIARSAAVTAHPNATGTDATAVRVVATRAPQAPKPPESSAPVTEPLRLPQNAAVYPPPVQAAMAPAATQSDARLRAVTLGAVVASMRVPRTHPLRRRGWQLAGVFALASLVSSSALHSAIPPQLRPDITVSMAGWNALRQEGAKLRAAERAIEQAVLEVTEESRPRSITLAAAPELVRVGAASDTTGPPSTGRGGLDRPALDRLIASLPDASPETASPAVALPASEQRLSRVAPETSPAPSAPRQEPALRVAPEPEELDAAEEGDGDVRPPPTARTNSRPTATATTRAATARRRTAMNGVRRMSVGATPPPAPTKSKGILSYIGSLVGPEARLWSDPAVPKP